MPARMSRTEPEAEALWGCVLACAEKKALMELRKPPQLQEDGGTGSGAADGEGCVGPGGAVTTRVASAAWCR